MALLVELRVERAPTARVSLRMGCGGECAGELDVSQALTAMPPGEWRPLTVRLRCFEAAGADMQRIEAPFGLMTAGELALRISDVRLVSAAESEAVCP
jgi:beta-glucosidase